MKKRIKCADGEVVKVWKDTGRVMLELLDWACLYKIQSNPPASQLVGMNPKSARAVAKALVDMADRVEME